jgi:transcriptional regulator with XRE-family HTH domain
MNLQLKFKIFEKFPSQADFAQEVNVDESLVSRVVRGRRKLDAEKRVIWAEALASSPRELFGRNHRSTTVQSLEKQQ